MVRTLGDDEQAKAIPGILVYRFNSPLTYFNAPYFKRRVLALLVQIPTIQVPGGGCGGLLTHQDISVMSMVGELREELEAARHPHGDGRSARPDEPLVQTGGVSGSARMASSSARACTRPCA